MFHILQNLDSEIKFFKQTKMDAFSEITPFLFLTSKQMITTENLKKHGITCIIVASIETIMSLNTVMSVKRVIHIPLEDASDVKIIDYFDMINCIIENEIQKKGKAVIHCYAGVSRSATLVIAFLMKHYNLSFLKASNHVKKRRNWIKPNMGFIKQLKEYEKKLDDKNV